MKKLTNYLSLSVLSLTFISCSNTDDIPTANNITLQFNNTFKNTTIVLGDANSATATVNTSTEGQIHHFSELKYVISNIRLIKTDGEEVPYHVNDLDKGAIVVNQSKPTTLSHVLSNIPAGEYTQLKFGLGVKPDVNTLDEEKFPKFYAEAGANDTKMMWEWGTGYRFTKLEGYYDTDNKEMSIHTGSTVNGTNGNPSSYTQGVDAYRDITLSLPFHAIVGKNASKIIIKADFDKLLSGTTNTIKLGSGNAKPSIHTAANMVLFVDNLGGNRAGDLTGIFSVSSITN